jgi:hypothetical protein
LPLLDAAFFEFSRIIGNPAEEREYNEGEDHPGERLRLPDNSFHKGALECSRFPTGKKVSFAHFFPG